ncbi:MAG: hypothetical protein VR67_11715 [Peptococcaceae bacterium BRH_c8a]|nr:MAG: hypothetical protein VR67_11715 [Peptococcaceae bacterium BRH_c8a]
MVRKKNILIIAALVYLLIGFSGLASASIEAIPDVYVTPRSQTVNADNWAEYDVYVQGQYDKYYMVEIWHDGYRVSTFYNFAGDYDSRHIQDLWEGISAGTHTATFKLYQQKAYNSMEKASGLLASDSVTVKK